MAAANLPFIYKPLLDDDGIIDDAFHVLSHYSYLMEILLHLIVTECHGGTELSISQLK